MNKIINTEYKDYGNALKGQNNSAWGNALRYEIAGQARNDGRGKKNHSSDKVN